MSEIINETINQLNKPTQNNVFSIEDDPVTVLEKINQVERYLKEIDTHVDTSINTANEALEKANNAFEANGTLVKINGENQLTWSADFAESERQKSKNLFGILKTYSITQNNITITINSDTQKILINGTASSSGTIAFSSDEIAPISVKNGEYFTISKTPNVAINVGINNKESPSGSIIYVNNTEKAYTNTITQDDKANRLYFWYDTGDTFNNVEFGIQVEKGSVATDYQPYNGAIVHEKDIEPDLIYDIDTKNTIGGTAYASGINYGTIINNDFTPYKKVKVYAYRPQNGPFTYEINLEQKDIGQNVYSGSGICYSYQEADNYFVYSSASISENKQQLRIIKCGYTSDFFTTLTLSTTCYIYRLEGYK